jgi:hypothetical protein
MNDIYRVGYGISHWESARGTYYGWRVSMALQFIPEFVFLLGVFSCPETYVPLRWTVPSVLTAPSDPGGSWKGDVVPMLNGVLHGCGH